MVFHECGVQRTGAGDEAPCRANTPKPYPIPALANPSATFLVHRHRSASRWPTVASILNGIRKRQSNSQGTAHIARDWIGGSGTTLSLSVFDVFLEDVGISDGAMIRSVAPQAGKVQMSMPKNRFECQRDARLQSLIRHR